MKIAITRLKGKEAEDESRCRKFGHECFAVSPMRYEVHQDRVAAFVRTVERGELDCLFFTSALPAMVFGPLIREITLPRTIAIGPQTAKALRDSGVSCEVMQTHYSADFIPYLGEWINGKKIGIPRADVPNPALISAIIEAGGIPYEIRCYSLIPTEEELDINGADAILFTSAMSFKKAIWKRNRDLVIMAIGEVTASVMRESGLPPKVTGDGTLEGTLDQLNRYIGTGDLKNQGPAGNVETP
jgi:uroporphyrinogen-III synthase